MRSNRKDNIQSELKEKMAFEDKKGKGGWGKCMICKSSHRKAVDDALRAGYAPQAIGKQYYHLFREYKTYGTFCNAIASHIAHQPSLAELEEKIEEKKSSFEEMYKKWLSQGLDDDFIQERLKPSDIVAAKKVLIMEEHLKESRDIFKNVIMKMASGKLQDTDMKLLLAEEAEVIHDKQKKLSRVT